MYQQDTHTYTCIKKYTLLLKMACIVFIYVSDTYILIRTHIYKYQKDTHTYTCINKYTLSVKMACIVFISSPTESR